MYIVLLISFQSYTRLPNYQPDPTRRGHFYPELGTLEFRGQPSHLLPIFHQHRCSALQHFRLQKSIEAKFEYWAYHFHQFSNQAFSRTDPI